MIGNREHGPLLTQEQVDALTEGTKVIVTWSGGNGPWEYTVIGRHGEHVFVDTDHKDFLDFVGAEGFHTHVSLASNQESKP